MTSLLRNGLEETLEEARYFSEESKGVVGEGEEEMPCWVMAVDSFSAEPFSGSKIGT